MRPGRRPLLLAAALLPTIAGSLQGQGLRASVDRTEITVEDHLLLTLTVEGSQNAVPSLPEIPGFQVYPRGQSTQMQLRGGEMTASASYAYLLRPEAAGRFTIGAARVEIDGRVHTSEPITVRVLPAGERPADERDLFITAEVSDPRPYTGQQILYTWRLYRRVLITEPRLADLEFPGFAVEEMGDVREFRTTVGGREFLVNELKRALFPQEEGTLTIPGPTLTCGMVTTRRRQARSLLDEFLDRRTTVQKTFRTEPVTVTVRGLPPRPPGFSGLVGAFDIRSEVSRRQLRVGESATVEVTVTGTGNARMIPEPAVPELSAFKVYDDQPTGGVEVTAEGLRGEKSFSKALVPLAPGELEVPPFTLTYFDPESGRYRTASTAPITLEVAPAEGEEPLRLTGPPGPAGKASVRILADDILPLHKSLDAVADHSLPGAGHGLWWTGMAAPPAVCLGLLAARRRRRRLLLDTGLRRRRSALRTARATLRRAEAELRAGDEPAACLLASRSVRGFVGDKLGIEGAALTPAEAADHLAWAGVGRDLVASCRRLLEGLDATRYGAAPGDGASRHLIGELDPLLKELDPLLKELDPLLKELDRALGNGAHRGAARG